MKGFKNSTKMVSGHNFATGGTVNRFATGGIINRFAGGGEVGGLDANRPDMSGHAQVQREIPSTEELASGGGRTPLNPGYKSGGKAEKHFHVHHHYHGGKVSKSKMRKMEMQGEHKATGGHIQDNTREIAPDYATGGTINRMAKGGKWIAGATKNKGALHRKLGVPEGQKIPAKKLVAAAHSSSPTERKEANLAKTLKKMHKATGGTINRLNAGGAMYSRGGKMPNC